MSESLENWIKHLKQFSKSSRIVEETMIKEQKWWCRSNTCQIKKKKTVSDPKAVILCDDFIMITLVWRRSEQRGPVVKREKKRKHWNVQHFSQETANFAWLVILRIMDQCSISKAFSKTEIWSPDLDWKDLNTPSHHNSWIYISCPNTGEWKKTNSEQAMLWSDVFRKTSILECWEEATQFDMTQPLLSQVCSLQGQTGVAWRSVTGIMITTTSTMPSDDGAPPPSPLNWK